MTVPVQEPTAHQVSSSSEGYQRWQVASKRYKKDVVIKAVAIAALVIVATALATVTLMYLPVPPAINLPIKILLGVSAGAFTLSGVMDLRLRLHPFEHQSYHKEEKAKEVCERIRAVYQKIPMQRKSEVSGMLGRKAMYKYAVRRIKEWHRYGFLTKDSRKRLAEILYLDKKCGRAIDHMQQHGGSSDAISRLNAQRETLSQMWGAHMTNVVIPGLPFSR